MRRLLGVAVPAIVIAATTLSAQSGPASPEINAVRKQIEANEQAVGRAIQARDFNALEKLWSPRMVVNGPDNKILTRSDVMAAMQRGGLNYASLKGSIESFAVFGDIAVEMGHEDFAMAAGPAAGKPLQRRYTNVWQRTGDQWAQIARQATILNEDAAFVYGAPAGPAH